MIHFGTQKSIIKQFLEWIGKKYTITRSTIIKNNDKTILAKKKNFSLLKQTLIHIGLLDSEEQSFKVNRAKMVITFFLIQILRGGGGSVLATGLKSYSQQLFLKVIPEDRSSSKCTVFLSRLYWKMCFVNPQKQILTFNSSLGSEVKSNNLKGTNYKPSFISLIHSDQIQIRDSETKLKN